MRAIRWGVTAAVAIMCLAAAYATAADKKADKQLAITFNDVPAAPGFGPIDPQGINYQILAALKKHNVKAAGFVAAVELDDAYDVIGKWLNDGHVIGSMTYSNEDLNELGPEKFIQEAQAGFDELEDMLESFGQARRYFRYPFLHYGQTKEEKRIVREFLRAKNEVIAHATVTPDDHMYNYSLNKLGNVLDSSQYVLMRDEYLNHILDELDRAEATALHLAGRPVKQILLLHCNRLNAVYLDELLTALEDAGYSFVSLDAALRDDIYAHSENYFGLRGVGYLDMIALGEKK